MHSEKLHFPRPAKNKLSVIAFSALALMLPLSGNALAKKPPKPPKTVNITNPRLKHVFIVLEENIGYAALQQELAAGNMPYLKSLIASGGWATNFFANSHPSLPNYFELTTGNTIATDDGYPAPIPEPQYTDVVAILDSTKKLKNGKPAPHPLTWKAYGEGVPNPPLGPGNGDPYEMHHNPFAYFPEVINDKAEQANIVDTTVLAQDIAHSTLPSYGFIVPNAYHSGHTPDPNAPQGQNREVEVDQWLQANIAPLVAAVNQNDGLLVIAWDEGDGADTAHGGGQIGVLLAGQKVKPGYQSVNLYQHQSTLRLMLQALGIKKFPGDAPSAPQMGEFFHK